MPSNSTSSSLSSRIRLCHCREKLVKVTSWTAQNPGRSLATGATILNGLMMSFVSVVRKLSCEQMEKIASLSVELAKSKSKEKAVSVKAEKLKMKLNVVSVCLALSWVIIGLYILMIVAIVVSSNKGALVLLEDAAAPAAALGDAAAPVAATEDAAGACAATELPAGAAATEDAAGAIEPP
uniref:Uncharacterized protein n=1 Tax=Fagus sylvatica TaxID=28930 RepID=A0A2N9GZE2_FAGSY